MEQRAEQFSIGGASRLGEDAGKEAMQLGKTQERASFVSYKSYLNKLCPPLSEAEEERLARESGDDVRVLLGFVFENSPRSIRWLEKALKKAPNDPLVLYTVYHKEYPGADQIHAAKELARLAPKDASPLYFLALESLKKGDRASADQYLQDASQREWFSSFTPEARQLAIDNYVMAGRSEADARARVALEDYGHGRERDIVGKLSSQLNLLGPDGVTIWASPENTAMLLDAREKMIRYSSGTDLTTYSGTLLAEIAYLRGIAAEPTGRTGEYLTAPASEILANVKAESDSMMGVTWFGGDKPGIYQRLQPEEQIELIDRFYRDGEISAFQWAYNTRPDIFNSPSFAPLGQSPENWAAILDYAKAQASKGR